MKQLVGAASYGFSLIELMVVIAIVALLAAVAVPAYKVHTVKARIAALAPTVDSYITKVRAYYDQFGTWPQASNLNLASSGYVVSGTNPNPDVLLIGIANNWPATNCPGNNTSVVIVVFSGASLGVTFNNAYNYGGTSNSLTWVTQVYLTGGSKVLSTLCGSSANAAADNVYLPTACQQAHPTPTCS